MATQVALHRADLAELARMSSRDLAAGMRGAPVDDAAGFRDMLADVLQGLVAVYGDAAGALGADWYEELRDEAEVRGRFQAIVADLPDVGRTSALAGWAVEPLFGQEPDSVLAIRRAAGGLQRIVLDVDRATVAGSSVADPAAVGWRRTGAGKCSFCRMLIGRGAVYSEATVQFKSHDHCECTAVPDFDAPRLMIRWGAEHKKERLLEDGDRRDPRKTTGIRSDADRARLAQWLRDHPEQ